MPPKVPVAIVLSLLTLVLASGCEAGDEPPSRPGESFALPEPASGDEGTRLFLAGIGEITVVDVDAGTSRVVRLPELAPGDPPYLIARRGKKLVFYGGDTYAVDLDLRLPPEKVGESWFFVPAAEPDRVWLALLDPTSPENVRGLEAVREVDVDGRVTVPDVAPPGGRWPLGEVGSALVFDDGADGLEIWDPRRPEPTWLVPDARIAATHRERLAWCDDAFETLHVAGIDTSAERTVRPPRGFVAFDCSSAAFSPDGSLLAVPIAMEQRSDGNRALALVDVASGLVRTVTGSSVEPGYVFVAWASDGESVFVTGGERFERRSIVRYRLASERASRVPVEVGDFYGIAAS